VYLPASFAETDPEVLATGMRSWPLATIVEETEGRLDANHIPLLLVEVEPGRQVLHGHAPRANPIGDDARDGKPVLVIFMGPSAYISPSWYPTKRQHGRVVPTFNYEVIHVHGSMRIIDDPVWVRAQLVALTRQQEATRETPWAVSDAPDDYIENNIGRLKGIEIRVESMIGKTKASQNQPEVNRQGVLEGLRSAGALATGAVERTWRRSTADVAGIAAGTLRGNDTLTGSNALTDRQRGEKSG
jgi:transcriptional regulator